MHYKCNVLIISTVLSMCSRNFIEPAWNWVIVYLTAFFVHILYKVFYCISICLAWVGVIFSVYTSVGVW